MCGITGYWLKEPNWNRQQHQAALEPMVKSLHARGPDETGNWIHPEVGIALGHTRLAIQDRTAAGQQPMRSQNGNWTLSYNGELYHTKQLRQELESAGTTFRGHSDTELLVEALALWGWEKTAQRLNGMFAFAAWNQQQQTLTLVRDRIGIKPLYYGWNQGNLLFGSELKALRNFPRFDSKQNRQAVCEYLQVGYIPAPLSIEQDIYKLLPGHAVTFHCSEERAVPQSFWKLTTDAYLNGKELEPITSEAIALEELDRLLKESVSGRLVSDVPLGAFLSGGIDSSLVVALMQQLNPHPVKTFSIGFEEEAYNEAEEARKIARHLKTEHHEMIVTSQQARDVIPLLPSVYDEPFADSSQIPTWLVSQFARQQVTVALSGDGGDELFGGYRRYPWFLHLWQRVQKVPRFCRPFIGSMLNAGAHLPVSHRYRQSAQWRADLMGVHSFPQCYEQYNRHWKKPEQILSPEFREAVFDQQNIDRVAPYCLMPEGFGQQFGQETEDLFNWMMLHDSLKYLPDDILTKVDRASMSHGLEVRVPLLDHQLVQFSWRLPGRMKQGGQFSQQQQTGKVLLRKLLSRYLPSELFERPKVGFGVPLDHWLRGPLKEWAEELLDEQHLRQQGVFQPEPIRQTWQAHLSGQTDAQYLLWNILMFQAVEGAGA